MPGEEETKVVRREEQNAPSSSGSPDHNSPSGEPEAEVIDPPEKNKELPHQPGSNTW